MALSRSISPANPEELSSVLATWDEHFDPAENLIQVKSVGRGFHTQLPPGTCVHATRHSANYAAVCMMEGSVERVERALCIVERLLPLQVTEARRTIVCGRDTFALWPWYVEEPVETMVPPDLNWADFIGIQLLEILRWGDFSQNSALAAQILTALKRCAVAVRERNVSLSYTNVAVMGVYMAITVGQLTGDEAMLEYGRERLRFLHRYTMDYDGFPEYNSPTYTTLAVRELARMMQDFEDAGDIALVSDIYDLAWRDIAIHWHAPTRQWAGPHRRSYQTFLFGELKCFLQRSLGDTPRILEPKGEALVSLFDIGVRAPCPAKWRKYFESFHGPRVVSQPCEGSESPLRAITYMTDKLALGSVAAWSCWKQQIPLVGYFNRSKILPATLRLRTLVDGDPQCDVKDSVDLPGSYVRCSQDKARVLAAITLNTDGFHHARLMDGRLTVSDLRVRIEVVNLQMPAATSLQKAWEAGSVRFPLGNGLDAYIALGDAQFAGNMVRFESYLDMNASSCDQQYPGKVTTIVPAMAFDVVLYQGAAREFALERIEAAYAVLALAILESEEAQPPSVRVEECQQGTVIQAVWPLADTQLPLKCPKAPLLEKEHREWDATHLDRTRGRETRF